MAYRGNAAHKFDTTARVCPNVKSEVLRESTFCPLPLLCDERGVTALFLRVQVPISC
jgi:hypothetical protein